MVTGQQIADAAAKLVGTAFRHQGRSAMSGLDCSGLLVLAHQMVGLDVSDFKGYSCPPRPRDLVDGLQRNCAELREAKVGCVILFRAPNKRAAQHTAIDAGGGMMIHSEIGKGVIRERWRGTAQTDRILGYFGHRGVRW